MQSSFTVCRCQHLTWLLRLELIFVFANALHGKAALLQNNKQGREVLVNVVTAYVGPGHRSVYAWALQWVSD